MISETQEQFSSLSYEIDPSIDKELLHLTEKRCQFFTQ